MAEAHSAVAFSFQVTHDGVSVSYDQELLRNIWHTVARGYKKRVASFKNDFRTGIYPASPQTLLVLTIVVVGLYAWGIDTSMFGVLPWIERVVFRRVFGQGLLAWLLSSVFFSIFVWFLLIQVMRLGMKMLFSYKGWMYESHRNVSLTTKVWLGIVHVISKSGPMLHSYQGALPRLPVPSLQETVDRHLKSVRPLFDDEQYDEMVRLSEEFQKGVGRKLQWYLHLKSWVSANYVSDWWEEYVYLKSREPIMINNNYYGLDTIRLNLTQIQAARAGNVTYSAMKFRRALDKQELKPVMILGVPLCSSQYERLFNSSRIPGEKCDSIKHWKDSRHIAVYHKGCWYRVPTHRGQTLLKPNELEVIFQDIIDREDTPDPGEEKLGALTAGKRVPWAQARKKFFATGVNKSSLQTIDQAAFVLILDDEEQNYDENDSEKLDRWAHSMMHGKGYDRWFDKTFTLVITKNGRSGINGEHSWADGPVTGHLMEYLFWMEMELHYAADGHTKGERPDKDCLPPAKKLKWDIPAECQTVIESSYQTALSLLNDVEIRLLVFEDYGKGFMKKQGISPDAYCQMALQLSFFRDQGKFDLTYEACMTRLFREGRTETVRSVTMESCDFVRSMLNESCSNEERLALLKKASEVHQRAYKECMCGKGIDRHIFALYLVSRYLEIESPFLHSVIHEPWMLSTSQTPHQQTDLLDLKKHPEFVSTGGGFGPVTERGYGISYIVGGEEVISFHISAKKSADNTDPYRFRKTLVATLREMRELCESVNSAKTKIAENGGVFKKEE